MTPFEGEMVLLFLVVLLERFIKLGREDETRELAARVEELEAENAELTAGWQTAADRAQREKRSRLRAIDVARGLLKVAFFETHLEQRLGQIPVPPHAVEMHKLLNTFRDRLDELAVDHD